MNKPKRLLVVDHRDVLGVMVGQVYEHLIEQTCVRHQISVETFKLVIVERVWVLLGAHETCSTFKRNGKVKHGRRPQGTLEIPLHTAVRQFEELQRIRDGNFGARDYAVDHLFLHSRGSTRTRAVAGLVLR